MSQVARVRQQIDRRIATIHLLHRSALLRRYAEMQRYCQQLVSPHQSIDQISKACVLGVDLEGRVDDEKGAI